MSIINNRKQRIRSSANFRTKAFHNLVDEPMMATGSGFKMLRDQVLGREQRYPPAPLPIMRPTARDYATPPATGLRVTWLGHSSLIVELGNIKILTDPVWAERASPVAFAGPKRFHPPPIALNDLPQIDLVLLSHDHYDHLDEAVIRWLARKSMPFVAGLGMGDYLEAWGVASRRIYELDWWEELDIPELGVQIASVPAQHFSGRSLVRNQTLWSSWAVSNSDKRIFVGCDSGWFDGFAQIGARYAPFDFASIEMAQYNESWRSVHMFPEQAIDACRALGAKTMLPVHWGTFCLSFHAWNEPVERLLAAHDGDFQILTPNIGQLIEPTAKNVLNPWWRSMRR